MIHELIALCILYAFMAGATYGRACERNGDSWRHRFPPADGTEALVIALAWPGLYLWLAFEAVRDLSDRMRGRETKSAPVAIRLTRDEAMQLAAAIEKAARRMPDER